MVYEYHKSRKDEENKQQGQFFSLPHHPPPPKIYIYAKLAIYMLNEHKR